MIKFATCRSLAYIYTEYKQQHYFLSSAHKIHANYARYLHRKYTSIIPLYIYCDSIKAESHTVYLYIAAASTQSPARKSNNVENPSNLKLLFHLGIPRNPIERKHIYIYIYLYSERGNSVVWLRGTCCTWILLPITVQVQSSASTDARARSGAREESHGGCWSRGATPPTCRHEAAGFML